MDVICYDENASFLWRQGLICLCGIWVWDCLQLFVIQILEMRTLNQSVFFPIQLHLCAYVYLEPETGLRIYFCGFGLWNVCFYALLLMTSFVGTTFLCVLLLQKIEFPSVIHFFILNHLLFMDSLVSLGWDKPWKGFILSGWKLLGMDWELLIRNIIFYEFCLVEF